MDENQKQKSICPLCGIDFDEHNVLTKTIKVGDNRDTTPVGWLCPGDGSSTVHVHIQNVYGGGGGTIHGGGGSGYIGPYGDGPEPYSTGGQPR